MIDTKILEPQKLIQLVQKLRSEDASTKLVFTNGCFDLLHPGHVRYLEKAHALGTLLIVGANTDASVQRLKGPTRPINSLEDRVQVLAALSSVSYVTWFDDDTPLELIKGIQPDILAKGGDWTTDKIVGSEFVLKNGGDVHSVPLVEGKSTTSIIEKSQK